jgi:hypothetical protein
LLPSLRSNYLLANNPKDAYGRTYIRVVEDQELVFSTATDERHFNALDLVEPANQLLG